MMIRLLATAIFCYNRAGCILPVQKQYRFAIALYYRSINGIKSRPSMSPTG